MYLYGTTTLAGASFSERLVAAVRDEGDDAEQRQQQEIPASSAPPIRTAPRHDAEDQRARSLRTLTSTASDVPRTMRVMIMRKAKNHAARERDQRRPGEASPPMGCSADQHADEPDRSPRSNAANRHARRAGSRTSAVT